ncbi:MAG TPA: hypothetical protein VMB34_04145 [Acetobacteraceae bacterium]|nr:hypothetical protein [Acetobacteraceae bacterium]
MGVCSLRVIGGQLDSGAYHSIPLSDWQSYTVATDAKGTQAFSIRACTVESEKGKLLGWGATPSAIKGFLQSPDYRGMHVASQSGLSYVNVRLKQNKENASLKKVEALVELRVAGQIYGVFKAMTGLANLGKESEVEFSITAERTDDTKCVFRGKQTLLQIYYAAIAAKAFSCADATIAQKAAAVGEIVANALGPAGGVVSDGIGALAQMVVPAAAAAQAPPPDLTGILSRMV